MIKHPKSSNAWKHAGCFWRQTPTKNIVKQIEKSKTVGFGGFIYIYVCIFGFRSIVTCECKDCSGLQSIQRYCVQCPSCLPECARFQENGYQSTIPTSNMIVHELNLLIIYSNQSKVNNECDLQVLVLVYSWESCEDTLHPSASDRQQSHFSKVVLPHSEPSELFVVS